MTTRAWFLLLVTAALASSYVAAQQPTTGSIGGRVVDEVGAAVPGATVTVSSTQGAKRIPTNRDGRFLAPYLTPGSYAVRVEKEGFRPVERGDLRVRLGQRLDLEFTLSPGSFGDTVEVTGTSPAIDFATASMGLGIGGDLLEQIPVGRRLSDTLYLAPGVSDSGGPGVENPSISGASGLENQYVVDGVNITDPRYGALGVYSAAYGSLGSGVTYDFIDEIQVRTAGAEAEFEQSTGGVVNVVTKSGSNELRGSLFSYLSPRGLEGERRAISLANGAVNVAAQQSSEFGFTLGGPLVSDRLFFFVAANAQRRETSYLAQEGFALADLGEVDRVRDVLSYAAKATFTPGSAHRVEASLFGDPAEAGQGPQGPEAMTFRDTGGFSALDYGGHDQVLSYQGIFGFDWLLEASLARVETWFMETPLVDEWLVQDRTTTPTLTSGGKGRFERDNDSETWQLRAKSTHVVGRHEIRYGIGYEDIDYGSFRDYTGAPITLSDGQLTVSGVQVTVLPDPTYGAIYRVGRGNLSRTRASHEENLGLFLQDRVELGDRLTLSAGLRYERQFLEGDTGSFTFGGNWAPRLGLVYDPTGTGRVKVFASAGVFYAKIPNNLGFALFQGGGRVLLADYFDAQLTEPVPDGVEALGTTQHLLLAGTDPVVVEPGAKPTAKAEATVGVELEALPDLVLGLRYLYRDMTRVLEDVGTAAMVLYFTGQADAVQYFITNPERGFPPTIDGVGAFEDPIHRFDAIELTANKRFGDNWSLLASYQWSKLRGTYEGYYRNDTGRSAPNNSGLFDFPTDDPSYTEIGVPVYGFGGDVRYLGDAGPLPNDRPHELKVHGAYAFDFGLTVGGGLAVSSGRPLTPMAANPVYDRAGDIPEAPRGSGIETEDGFRRRTPTLATAGLHVDYAVELPRGELVLLLDVFNLLDADEVVQYDQNTELGYLDPNPDFGRAVAFQEPREIRLAVRFQF